MPVFRFIALFLVVGPLVAQVRAADSAWNGGGLNSNWATGANWNSGLAPMPGDRLFFDGNTGLTPFNNLFPGTLYNNLTFNSNAGPFTLNGNYFLLSGASGSSSAQNIGGSITNFSPADQTINLNLSLDSGNHAFATASGAGQLMFFGAITRNGGAVVRFTQNGGGITAPNATNVNGILGGWAVMDGDWATVASDGLGNIIPYGAYTVVSGGSVINNDPTSNVRVVTAGTNLSLAAPGTTGINTLLCDLSSAQTVDVGASNRLRLGPLGGISRGANTTDFALTIGAIVGNGVLTAGGSDDVDGEIVLNAGEAANTQTTIIINSTITDNGLGTVTVIKSGQAAAQLFTNNSYSGGTYVSQGRLQANNSGAFGSGPVFVLSGGQAFLNGAGTYSNDFVLSGIGTFEGGGGGAIRSSKTISGTVTLQADARVGGGLTIGGQITGGYSLEIGGGVSGSGNNRLSSSLNNYTGGTTINSSGGATSLILGNSEVIPDGDGKGNLTLIAGIPIATLNLNGHDETINGLRSFGTVARTRVNSGVAGAATLTVGSGNAIGSFGGSIQNGSGTVALTKIGSGTQILSGSNSYTGPTTISRGTLQVDGTLAGSTVMVSSNGVLSGGGTIHGPVAVAPGGLLEPGNDSTGTMVLTSDLTLAGNVQMTLGGDSIPSSLLTGMGTVTYGGTLVVTSFGSGRHAGDCFTLFTAASYTGSFAAITLPFLDRGLGWDTSSLAVNGSICVVLLPSLSYTINISPGDNFIANQLDHGSNTLDEVLPNAPDGSLLYKWTGTGYSAYTYDALASGWTPSGTATLAPGEGAIFRFPGGVTNTTLTFTGTPHLPVLPLSPSCGVYYLLSRQTNGIGTFENITGLSPPEGAQLFRHNPAMPSSPLETPNYSVHTFSGGVWSPVVPNVAIGEAIWLRLPCPSTPPCVSLQAPDVVVLSNSVTEVSFAPTAVGLCGSNIVSVVCVPPSGSLFPPGTTLVHCVALDGWGFVASCDFPVTVAPPPIPEPLSLYSIGILTGLNLIANQLDQGGNTLREIIPVAPDGAVVWKFDNTNGSWVKFSRYDGSLNAWVPATVTLNPGEGALLDSPTNFTLTIKGRPHVPILPISIPNGATYLLSKQTPDAGTYETITGSSPSAGAKVYKYNLVTQNYTEYDFLGAAWSGGLPPMAAVGESLWITASGGAPPPLLPVPPSLSLQPASLAVSSGSAAAFSVAGSGDGPLFYQWRLNGNLVPDATNSTLQFDNVQTTNAGTYTVVVYNSVGIVDSTSVTLLLTDLAPLGLVNTFSAAGTLTPATAGNGTGSNVGATTEAGEPMPGYIPGGASVWVRWQPAVSGIATFTTAGSGFDTLLAIYTGNEVNNLTRVAADDDSAGFLCSQVSFNAVAGVNYAIQIDGFYGATGNILLTWNLEQTTDQLPVILSQTKSVTTGAGSNVSFSVSVPLGSSVSYEWSMNGSPILGETNGTLTLANVGIDQVGVYRVSVAAIQSSRSILSLPFDLQLNSGGQGEPVNTETRAEDKFLAAVDTTVRPNDPYDPAIVSGFTGTQIFTTYGTSGDPGEPEHCGVLCAFTKWHYYSFATNSLVVVDNRGTTFGGVLAVYSGAQSGATYANLVPVACSASHGMGDERVTFVANAGVTYSVMMAGTNLADIGGTVVLNHTATRPPIFTLLPISQTVGPANSLNLTVAASGYPPVGFQWRLNGTNLPGANSTILPFSPFASGNQGNYSIVATNSAGTNVFAFSPVYLNTSLRFINPAEVRNLFYAQFAGIATSNYIIQASSNLITWTPVLTNASASGIITFTETNTLGSTKHFFRATTPPAIP